MELVRGELVEVDAAVVGAAEIRRWDAADGYGVRTASLWTILENPSCSVALYESLGYRIVERQPRYRKPF